MARSFVSSTLAQYSWRFKKKRLRDFLEECYSHILSIYGFLQFCKILLSSFSIAKPTKKGLFLNQLSFQFKIENQNNYKIYPFFYFVLTRSCSYRFYYLIQNVSIQAIKTFNI